MKRILAFILSLVMVVVFCSGEKQKKNVVQTKSPVSFEQKFDPNDRNLQGSYYSPEQFMEFSNRYGANASHIFQLLGTESFVYAKKQSKSTKKNYTLRFYNECTVDPTNAEFTVYENDKVAYSFAATQNRPIYFDCKSGVYKTILEKIGALSEENAKYFTLDRQNNIYKYSFLKQDGSKLSEEEGTKMPHLFVAAQNLAGIMTQSGTGALTRATRFYDREKNILSPSYQGLTDQWDGFVCSSNGKGFKLYYIYNQSFSQEFTQFDQTMASTAEPVLSLYFIDADTATISYLTAEQKIAKQNISIQGYKEKAKAVKVESPPNPVKKPNVPVTPSAPASQKIINIPAFSEEVNARLSTYSTKALSHSWLYPEAPDKLAAFDAYAVGDTSKNIVYLTFDAGYEYRNLSTQILDILAQKQVKAVFFVTLAYARDNPALVRRMIDEGHAVGNHSVNHPNMTKVDLNTAYNEVKVFHDYMLGNFNYSMYLFRFPQGEYSDQTLALLKEMGYKSVFWNFAYKDWNTSSQPSESLGKESVMRYTKNGTIYLLHACSTTNVKILPEIIDNIRLAGYTFEVFNP